MTIRLAAHALSLIADAGLAWTSQWPDSSWAGYCLGLIRLLGCGAGTDGRAAQAAGRGRDRLPGGLRLVGRLPHQQGEGGGQYGGRGALHAPPGTGHDLHRSQKALLQASEVLSVQWAHQHVDTKPDGRQSCSMCCKGIFQVGGASKTTFDLSRLLYDEHRHQFHGAGGQAAQVVLSLSQHGA